MGFSGWGGIDLAKVPAELLPASNEGLIHQYYTPVPCAVGIWRLLSRLHDAHLLPERPFALEPSAGIGRLMWPAPSAVTWHAVEVAEEAARLLEGLYPDTARVRVFRQSFEEYVVSGVGARFDIIVGNPPYAARGLRLRLDPGGRRWSRAAHYFLDAAAGLLAPGGIMIQIVPAGVVMDPKQRDIREALLRRCNWLGAYGLPSTLFPGARLALAAIVVQRREAALDVASDLEVLEGRYWDGEGKDNLAGPMQAGYRGMEIHGALDPAHLAAMHLRGLTRPSAASAPRVDAQSRPERGPVPARPERAPQALDALEREQLLALASRLVAWRQVHASHPELAEAGRPELASDVSRFVAAHGRGWRGAPDLRARPEVMALAAMVRDDGSLSPALAEPREVGRYQGDRGDLAAVVAYVAGRQNRGYATESEVRAVIESDVLQALEADRTHSVAITWGRDLLLWPWDRYLEGRLYERLDALIGEALPAWVEARYATQRRRLIDAIAPLSISDIDLDPRAGWIPTKALEQFVSDTMGRRVSLWRENGLVLWAGLDEEDHYPARVAQFVAWVNDEAQYERPGKDRIWSKSRTRQGDIDVQIAADRKAVESFRDWVMSSEWGPELEQAYNRTFRGVRVRSPDTTALPLLRQSKLRLRPHQNAAIRLVGEQGYGIVAHEPGLGKTLLVGGLVAYWRQLGISDRTLVVVPKQVLANWLREMRRLLPDYRVVTVGLTVKADGSVHEDSAATKRRKWQQIAAGDMDLAICTIPNFIELPVRPEREIQLYEQAFWAKREQALAVKEAAYRVRRRKSLLVHAAVSDGKTAKQLKKQAETLVVDEAPTAWKVAAAKQRFEQWMMERDATKKDDTIYFEDLGLRALIVDEAHNYKNLMTVKHQYGDKAPKFLGAPSGDTQRCWDLWLKCAHLRSTTGGSGVVLLSGTPIKNSPLEAYNLVQYVRPEVFEDRGTGTPEAFIQRYLRIGVKPLLSTKGEVEELATFVAGFANLEELRALLSEVMDYRTAQDVGLKLPEAHVSMVSVPMSRAAVLMYAELREQAKLSAEGDSKAPHILAILHRMREVALDPWLQDPTASELPAKFTECAKRIAMCAPGCSHIVFIDVNRSIPRVKQALVRAGMKEERIAVLTGEVSLERRAQIEEGLNGVWDPEGREIKPARYDVVIGNSQVMAEGVNLQRRACTLHHLELPWEPATLAQRNARAVRQGNANDNVQVVYYLSERSFDGYRLQMIAGKRGWMADLLRGAGNEMNNPLADTDVGADDLLVMLAADEAEARKAMETVKSARLQEWEAKRRTDALSAFAKAVQLFSDARSPRREVAVRDRLRVQANGLVQLLAATSTSVFPRHDLLGIIPHRRVVLLEVAGTYVAFREGGAVCHKMYGRETEYLVIAADSAKKLLVLRELGTWVPESYALSDIDRGWSECDWDADRDRARLRESQLLVDPARVKDIPEQLIEELPDALWACVVRRRYATVAIPKEVNGSLVIMAGHSALQGGPPIWPTDAGYARFVSLPTTESKKAKEEVSAEWFGRSRSGARTTGVATDE